MLPLTGAQLYANTSKLLLGFKMDTDLFYQLLGTAQFNRENMRKWVILRKEDDSQHVSPSSSSIYLNPLILPADFLSFYSPKRSIILVAPDGITFRYYEQISPSMKYEYKDLCNKFYIDVATNKLYLCGNLDQSYTVHQFYLASSPTVTDATSWLFPPAYHAILAFDVARMYKEMYDYDIVNAMQADKIEKGAAIIYRGMTEWDGSLQEDELEGVDYPNMNGQSQFQSNIVGDN